MFIIKAVPVMNEMIVSLIEEHDVHSSGLVMLTSRVTIYSVTKPKENQLTASSAQDTSLIETNLLYWFSIIEDLTNLLIVDLTNK